MFLDRLSIGLSGSALIASPLVYLLIDKLVGTVLGLLGLMIGLAWLAKRFRPQPLFTLKVEREGRLLIIITLAIGLAALNTGSNLLYLVLGMLLALIVASGLLSQLVLSKLTISRHVPSGIQASVAFISRTDLTNRKRWMPAFSLNITLSASKLGFGADSFVRCVDADQTQSVYSEFTFSRRGRHDLSTFEGSISTRFPFGLFTKSRRFASSGTVVVLPAPTSTFSDEQVNIGASSSTSRSLQLSDDVDGVKVFSEGDDLKRIDWKRSTIGEHLIVRDAPPTHGRTQHIWLCRSLSTVPFDPLEEAWISFIYELARRAQDRKAQFVLRIGDEVFETTSGSGGYGLIGQKLALLDAKTLPRRYAASSTGSLVIDISKLPSRTKAAQ